MGITWKVPAFFHGGIRFRIHRRRRLGRRLRCRPLEARDHRSVGLLAADIWLWLTTALVEWQDNAREQALISVGDADASISELAAHLGQQMSSGTTTPRAS